LNDELSGESVVPLKNPRFLRDQIKNLYKTVNHMIPRQFCEPPLFIVYLNILESGKVGSLQMDFLGQALVRPPLN
jgi:hypothetical protein